MFRTILWIIVLLLWAVPLYAQSVDTAWVRLYNGTGNSDDGPAAMRVDDSGNVYLTGSSIGAGSQQDYVTIKYDSNGDTVWLRRYNGEANSWDYASAMALDDSGNVYVTGNSWGIKEDYLTIKYDKDGNELWVKRYNGPGNGEDHARALAVDDSGNVYVAGGSDGGGENDDYLTIKYYPNGDTDWVRRFDGPANREERVNAIAVDNSGNVYVTGGMARPGSMGDYATIKYYANGETAWLRWWSGDSLDIAIDIDLDDYGNVYVTGAAYKEYYCDFATVKYDTSGSEIWVRKYDGSANLYDQVTDITVDRSGNIYLTGLCDYSWYNPPYVEPDYVTIKYYPNGDTAWIRTYNGPQNDADGARAITVDDSGNVYVTGYSAQVDEFPTYNFKDYATIKYDSSGDELWVKRYNGLAESDDGARGIAVDDSGNVYVTGSSAQNQDYPRNYDYTTIKYWYNEAPIAFSLYLPDDSTLIPCTCVVNFSWEAASDPDSADTVRYDLYVSASSNFDLDSTIVYDSLETNEYCDRFDIAIYYWKVRAYDNRGAQRWSSQTWTFLYATCGDANADSQTNISDVVYLVNYMFKSGPEPIPEPSVADVNCDDITDIVDAVYLVNYLFRSGPPPCQ